MTFFATLLQLPDLHSIPCQNRNQHTISFGIVTDVGGGRHAGDHLYFLAGFVRGHGGVGPARHQNPRADYVDAVESAGALGDDLGRFVPRLPREHRFGGPVRYDDEPLAHGVYRDPVRPAQTVTPCRHRHLAVGTDAEYAVGPGMQHVAQVVEPDSGIGDVDRAGRGDRDVVQEDGARAVEPDAVQRDSCPRIERADPVDVRHPQRVAEQRQALRRVEGYTRTAALDELEVLDRPVGPHAADEAVVVLRRRGAVDVRDKVDVLCRVVQHRFRGGETRYRQYPRGARSSG